MGAVAGPDLRESSPREGAEKPLEEQEHRQDDQDRSGEEDSGKMELVTVLSIVRSEKFIVPLFQTLENWFDRGRDGSGGDFDSCDHSCDSVLLLQESHGAEGELAIPGEQ